MSLTKEAVSHEDEEGMRENAVSIRNEIQNEDFMSEIPRALQEPSIRDRKPGVIFVLEKASLVLANVGRTYQILRSDKHADYLRRKKMNPYDYRPDIVHEALREIIASPLCRTGNVRGIFVKTVGGELIKVEPNCKMPGSLSKFCDMMAQCLQNFNVKAHGKSNVRLLRLIKNPVTQHLPLNSLKIGFSVSSKKLVNLQDYVCDMTGDINFVFVVGTMAHGKIDSDYIDDFISVSELPLSAGTCVRRIYGAMEAKLGIW